jgi:CheY-like chemotaxis protein
LSKTNFYYGCIPPERSKTPAFEVIQAGNADEAIAILKARPDIHVVFTDIQMRPGCRSIGIKNLCFSLTRCCIPGPSSIIRKKF